MCGDPGTPPIVDPADLRSHHTAGWTITEEEELKNRRRWLGGTDTFQMCVVTLSFFTFHRHVAGCAETGPGASLHHRACDAVQLQEPA